MKRRFFLGVVLIFSCVLIFETTYARRWLLYNDYTGSYDLVCPDGLVTSWYKRPYIAPGDNNWTFTAYDVSDPIPSLNISLEQTPDQIIEGDEFFPQHALWFDMKVPWDSLNLLPGDRVVLSVQNDIAAKVALSVTSCSITDSLDESITTMTSGFEVLEETQGVLSVSHEFPSVRDDDSSPVESNPRLSEIDAFLITDIDVHVNINHNNDDPDFQLILTSPEGTEMTIVNELPSPIKGLGEGGCDSHQWYENFPLTFDDESNYTLDQVDSLVNIEHRTYRTENLSLSQAVGEDAFGNWTLQIFDMDWAPENDDPTENSNLLCWALEISGIPIYRTYLPTISKSLNLGPDLIFSRLNFVNEVAELEITNTGTESVVNEFWVDLYIDPITIPTGVNQIWPNLGNYGAVWGVEGEALPLAPGETLTLTLGDDYFWPTLSNLPTEIAPGMSIYGQVDSANADTDYGAVLENHEISGGLYNNITMVTATHSFFLENEPFFLVGSPGVNPAGLPNRP